MSLSLGLGGARAAEPAAYAIGAVAPRHAFKPASAEEVAEALKAASFDQLKVIPWGGGTRVRRVFPAGGYDVALDLSGLTRIVEYEPEDFTVTAECGVTLATLRATLAARGQELPLESPRADRATLGGTLASKGCGPRRLRFGSPTDRLLGARFALSDGTLARSGGKVVKNVAGYGLHRMLCGARGGLAVMLEASFKLAPDPETRVALVYGMTRATVGDATRWGGLPRLEPAFVSVLGSAAGARLPEAARVDAPFVVVVGLEDDAGWVAEQESRMTQALGAPLARIDGEAVATLAQSLADAEDRDGPHLVFTSAHKTPAGLAPLLARTEAPHLVSHAAAGRLHWYPADDADANRVVRDALDAGYTLIGRSGVTIDPQIPPEVAVVALRQRLRAALDPGGTLPGVEG